MCEYCQGDFDGWYKPLDKNAHVCIFDKPHEKILDISWYGHKMKIDINYCPMCRQKIKLGGSMKVLEHGNFYQENRIIKCICGCKFEYEQNDIMTDTSLAYTTSPEQYRRYVRCPECDAKTELGTTYAHSITQRF